MDQDTRDEPSISMSEPLRATSSHAATLEPLHAFLTAFPIDMCNGSAPAEAVAAHINSPAVRAAAQHARAAAVALRAADKLALEAGLAAYQPIVDLASRDNVFVKISDVAGRSTHPFPHVDVHPYIRMLYDAFGSDRSMWGTGYPGHHRVKHNWHTLAEELRLICEGIPFLSERDREQILGKTAASVWQLAG